MRNTSGTPIRSPTLAVPYYNTTNSPLHGLCHVRHRFFLCPTTGNSKLRQWTRWIWLCLCNMHTMRLWRVTGGGVKIRGYETAINGGKIRIIRSRDSWMRPVFFQIFTEFIRSRKQPPTTSVVSSHALTHSGPIHFQTQPCIYMCICIGGCGRKFESGNLLPTSAGGPQKPVSAVIQG